MSQLDYLKMQMCLDKKYILLYRVFENGVMESMYVRGNDSFVVQARFDEGDFEVITNGMQWIKQCLPW